MSASFDGVIGDNHRIQAHDGGMMPGECTCMYCTAKVSEFWDIFVCIVAENVTFEKVKGYWSSGTHTNIGERLKDTPAAAFMGDVESFLCDRAFNIENSGSIMDANLHERTGLVKTAFW